MVIVGTTLEICKDNCKHMSLSGEGVVVHYDRCTKQMLDNYQKPGIRYSVSVENIYCILCIF